ncbi:alpha-N-arabinofuranosidase, partial [Enterococcus faecium]
VGRKEQRPKKNDLAWRGIEPNSFGLHEFFIWISHVQAKPIFTVYLGTKGIDEAKNLVEYCNYPKGTFWSDLRIKNGQKKPLGVKLWCLGNELDGPWQVGAK